MKKYILLIPTLLFPYAILLVLISLFTSSNVPAFSEMWEKLFDNNAFVALGIILIVFVILLIINVSYVVVSLKNKWRSREMSKTLLILKLIQVPAYIGIFIIGLLCMLTVFTIPIALFLVFLDYLCILLTGILMIPTIIRSYKENCISQVESIVYIILSFCLNLDVIVSIMTFVRCKSKKFVP